MSGSVIQTYMSDILHAITQALLVPDIVLLIAFIAYALFCIGSILAEFFSERKHFEVTMPKFLAALMAAEEDEIPAVIEESGLLKRQKIALLTVYDYRILPGDALVALIKRLVGEEESRYDRISGRNNMAARVSPMLGLMGTLIPLGPGIQALGNADTSALSASLLIAFDTTVAGLIVAAICMVIGKIRGNWYANYMSALDSAMATMLQKIEDMRAAGKIKTEKPSDYAFLFQKSVERVNDKGQESQETPDARQTAQDGASAASAPAAGSPASTATAQKTPAISMPAGYPADAARPRMGQSSAAGFSAGLPDDAQVPQATAGSFDMPARSAGLPETTGLNGWSPRNAGEVKSSGTYQQATAAGSPSWPAVSAGSAKPFVAGASFEPVPDPSFIGDLASAQAASAETGGHYAATNAPTANGWYQPNTRPEASPGEASNASSRMAWGTKNQTGSHSAIDKPSS